MSKKNGSLQGRLSGTGGTGANGGPGGPGPLPGRGEATPQEVQELLARGEAILVDVREPDEHARERIPGSRLVPLSRFDPQQAAAGLKYGQALVLHCRSGRRSADAARLAASLGEEGLRVINLAGGIEAWKAAGLGVETSRRAPVQPLGLSVMRQVQLTIGVGVLIGAALAWLVHPWFLALAAFFGAGLVLAGLTGTCALATVIGKLPWNRGAAGEDSCSGGPCG